MAPISDPPPIVRKSFAQSGQLCGTSSHCHSSEHRYAVGNKPPTNTAANLGGIELQTEAKAPASMLPEAAKMAIPKKNQKMQGIPNNSSEDEESSFRSPSITRRTAQMPTDTIHAMVAPENKPTIAPRNPLMPIPVNPQPSCRVPPFAKPIAAMRHLRLLPKGDITSSPAARLHLAIS